MVLKEWTQKEIDQIFRMVSEGFSMSQIAATLEGRTRNAVIGKYMRVRMSRLGYTPTPRGPNGKQLSELIDEPVRISPQLLRNTTPKRACEPRRPMPKVAKAGVGVIFKAPLVEPPKDGAVGILDVKGCKWAVGENPKIYGGHVFCNHETDGKSPYCAYHHKQGKAQPIAKGAVKRFKVPTSLLRAGAA